MIVLRHNFTLVSSSLSQNHGFAQSSMPSGQTALGCVTSSMSLELDFCALRSWEGAAAAVGGGVGAGKGQVGFMAPGQQPKPRT